MKRKTIAIICFFLIAAVIIPPVSGTAISKKKKIERQIEQERQKIEENSKEKKQINNKIEKINEQLKETEALIDVLVEQVYENQKKIEDTTKRLAEQKKKIGVGQSQLNSRLRRMYKTGSVGFVDVMLSSKDVSDLIFNIEMVQKIFNNDKKVIIELKSKYQEIKTTKIELETLKSSLKAKQQTLADTQSKLSSDRVALLDKGKKINIMNSRLSSHIDDLQEEADRLTEDIRRAVKKHPIVIKNPIRGDGRFGWPVPGYHRISSGFGWRIHPISGTRRLHRGIDIPAPAGTNICAAASGYVIAAYYNASYGKMVIISHGGGFATVYAHNSALLVNAGDKVQRGQVISKCGSTGNSTGPHCHFEVRVNGQVTNPVRYL